MSDDALQEPPEFADDTLELRVPSQAEVDRVWRSYWLPTLTADIEPTMQNRAGILMARIRAELYDAWHLVNEARKVYRHVTGGLTDDLTASGEGIIALAERHVEKRCEPLRLRIRELEAELGALRRRPTPVGAVFEDDEAGSSDG